jgi:hypothetical protein
MAVKIRKVDYYYAAVDDRPGQWARILEQLKKSKVNLLAVTAFPTLTGKVQIDFFPKDSEKFKAAAGTAGMILTGPKKGFLVQGEDKSGALVEIHRKLADAGINVVAANGAVGGSGRFGYIFWVKQENFEKAAQILGAK